MATGSTGSRVTPPPTGHEELPPTFTLQVISPSVGLIDRPLLFRGIPHATTIRQLRERIRQALRDQGSPLQPADDQQRLIYRGRLLGREEETLLQVFTPESLRQPITHTLHLVLRDRMSTAPTPAGPTRVQSPASGPSTNSTGPAHNSNSPSVRVGRMAAGPGIPAPLARPPAFIQPHPTPPHHAMPASGTAPSHQQPQQFPAQQHAQAMAQWMAQIQRDTAYRHALNQQQRDRAAMGFNGAQDDNISSRGRGRDSPGVQPERRTLTRQFVAPDGQHVQVTVHETVVGRLTLAAEPGFARPSASTEHQTGAPDQPGPATASAMERSLSNASAGVLAPGPAPIQAAQGTTISRVHSRAGSRAGSRRATPDPGRMWSNAANPPSAIPRGQPPRGPEVYILQSPSGPRALLFNNNYTETYVSPSLRRSGAPTPWLQYWQQTQGMSRPHTPVLHAQRTAPQQGQQVHARFPPLVNQAQPRHQQQVAQQGQGHHQAPANLQHHAPRALEGGDAMIALLGALFAALWPHIWLIFRLGLFIWWFTTPDSSLYRWLTVVSLAAAVFIYNTGVLNGVGDQFIGPIRRHMEGLMPLEANRHNQQDPAAPEVAAPNGDGRPSGAALVAANARPHPAQTAARLVAERRNANADWVMDQVRRIERAGLLFLASIAPGVAERHIAQLEAAERAERQRREAERAAAQEAPAQEATGGADNAETEEQVPQGAQQEAGLERREDEQQGPQGMHDRQGGNGEPLVAT